jgi:hypothetical protein
MGHATRLTIAIMDRNPHVRELMCREFAALGHAAQAVQTKAEVLRLLAGPELPQVLVLDPEALGSGLQEISARVAALAGRLTTVLHVYAEDPVQPVLPGAMLVEKEAHLGPLKILVERIAQGTFPAAAGCSGTSQGVSGQGA